MIYFAKMLDAVKIGYSSNPRSRISDLQVGASGQLECLLVIDGGFDEERVLHNRFAHLSTRTTGEWFYCKKEILDFVEENLKNDRRYEFGLVSKDFAGNEQLERLRTESNLTLTDVGKKLGITGVSVKEREDREAQKTITVGLLEETANAMGYKLEYRFVPIS